MASSTQTVIGEGSVEVGPSLVDRRTREERADLLERDRQTSSWLDMVNKATEISLNIGGLQAKFRIGVVILLGLVLCIVSIARWPTSSSHIGSQPSDAFTLDLSDISPVNVSTAEDTKNSHTPVSLENKNSAEYDRSKTQSAHAMSTFSPALAGVSDGEVSQVLEKAIQDLRYPTDQNETIEELQALNRELILKAHQQAVEETVQTLKKKVIRLIAWVSIAVAIADPILLVFFISIRALLRLYWYRDFCISGIEVDELGSPPVEELGHTPVEELVYPPVDELGQTPVEELVYPPVVELDQTPFQRHNGNPGLLCPVSPESRPTESVWRRYTVGSAFGGSISWPFLVRILSQSIYLGSAIYFLCKEQRTAGDITIIAGCGMSLLLSALSRTSAASTLWRTVPRKVIRRLCGLYEELDEFLLRGVSRLPYMMDVYYSIIRTEPRGRFTT